jgi:hypothetical protein
MSALVHSAALMSEKGSEADIEPCHVNVAEVPVADILHLKPAFSKLAFSLGRGSARLTR